MLAPTHKKISDVLRGVDSSIADFVEANEDQCWAELLLLVQQHFSSDVVARSIHELDKQGFGNFIRHAWCPATQALLDSFARVEKQDDG